MTSYTLGHLIRGTQFEALAPLYKLAVITLLPFSM